MESRCCESRHPPTSTEISSTTVNRRTSMKRGRGLDPEGSVLILRRWFRGASGRNPPARELPCDRSAPSVYNSGIWKEVRWSRICVPKLTAVEGSIDRPCAISARPLYVSRLDINDLLHTLFALLSATPRVMFSHCQMYSAEGEKERE